MEVYQPLNFTFNVSKEWSKAVKPVILEKLLKKALTDYHSGKKDVITKNGVSVSIVNELSGLLFTRMEEIKDNKTHRSDVLLPIKASIVKLKRTTQKEKVQVFDLPVKLTEDHLFSDWFEPRSDRSKIVTAKPVLENNPEEDICEKFLELAWRREVTTIVKASRRVDEESYQYWSPTEGSEIECGGFRVKTLKISEKTRFTLTVLRLSDPADRERQIRHYQYTAWRNIDEDHPFMFLSFVCSLNDMYTISTRKQPVGWKPGAVLVHCSDGLSCSAVYCIIDICVTQFKCTGTLSVAKTLQKLREQKYNCLNNKDDYTFCYQAIHAYVVRGNGMEPKIFR